MKTKSPILERVGLFVFLAKNCKALERFRDALDAINMDNELPLQFVLHHFFGFWHAIGDVFRIREIDHCAIPHGFRAL